MKYNISDYFDKTKSPKIFVVNITPHFSPIDINIIFLQQMGWNNSDRIRFHTEQNNTKLNKPLTELLSNVVPQILIRKYNKDEDYIFCCSIYVEGNIQIFSNDEFWSRKCINGLFFNFPPAFS